MFDLFLKSVGRGANLLLNVPPNRQGVIGKSDSTALVDFKKLRDKCFGNNLSRKGTAFLFSAGKKKPAPALNDANNNTFESIHQYFQEAMGIKFRQPTTINCIMLKEFIKAGQYCRNFRLLLMAADNSVLHEITGTTIGREKIITFPTAKVSNISLVIGSMKYIVSISEIGAYLIDEKLIGP